MYTPLVTANVFYALYEKIGFVQTLQELSGDYAIILTTSEDVYFARDPIGVRPLFYGFAEDGSFALSSYARALTNFCKAVYQIPPGLGKIYIENRKLTITLLRTPSTF